MWQSCSSEKKQRTLSYKSIIQNLRYREIYGVTSRNANRYATPHGRLFLSIPARLAFSLREIVDEHILMEEAHVFLGFSGDGTFVISYTESLEPLDQTGLPSYMYRLHWWLFRLNKKMIKIHSVRLFANEEIVTSLQLSYAEWPQEKSKIVVYGCSKDSENCYITVSAIPPRIRCENCIRSKGSRNQVHTTCLEHGFMAHMKYTSVSSLSAVLNASGLQINNLMVLNMGHSIGVISLGLLNDNKDIENLPLSSIKRAAYEDKPDLSESDDLIFPSSADKSLDFGRSSQLNTNSLNAILQNSLDAEQNLCLSNDSNRFMAEFSNSFKLSNEISEDTYTTSQSSSPPFNEYNSLLSASSSSLSLTPNCITVEETPDHSKVCSCKWSEGSENAREKRLQQADTANSIDPYFDPEPKSIVLLQRDCENICDGTGFYSSAADSNSCDQAQLKVISKLDKTSENCCCSYTPNGRCSEHGVSLLQNTKADKFKTKQELEKPSLKPSKKAVLKSNANGYQCLESITLSQNTKQSSAKSSKRICTYCGLKIYEQNVVKETVKMKKKEIPTSSVRSPLVASPGRNLSKLLIVSSIRNSRESQENYLELNAPTPSPSASESSGSVYCTGDAGSQVSYKSGNCHRTDGIVSFFETLYGCSRGLLNVGNEDTAPVAENSLFYGPVTFEGAGGIPLNPVKSDCFHQPVAYSQHLVLDVEHVIFDVLRTRCYNTYKFGYLIDYDVQIIDTCANTHSVVILIVALLNVSPRKSKVKLQEHHYRFNSNFEPTSNKSQQFQFVINWQLQTGRYEVVAASPLQVFDSKISGKWDASWVAGTRKAIRMACALPYYSHCSVHVLNNAAVFRGKSLNYLWDNDFVIALRK